MKGLKQSSRIFLLTLFLFASVFCQATISNAHDRTVIYVDDSNTSGIEDGTKKHPYNTINETLNMAQEGDKIFVLPGRYEENIDLPFEFPANVILQGKAASATHIQGNINIGTNGFSIKEFTIIGSTSVEGSFATVARNNIKGNIFVSGGGGSNIANNKIVGFVDAIVTGLFNVTNNEISRGGIKSGTTSRMVLEGNDIHNCEAGILVEYPWSVKILNNAIHNCDYGVLFKYEWAYNVPIVGNKIYSNKKAGIECRNLGMTGNIVNNLIINNGGPGILVDQSQGLQFFDANIINNTIMRNNGGIVVPPVDELQSPLAINIANCILWDNGDDLINVSATYSDIEDGDAGQGNISADPLLNSRHCPKKGSPAIDAGLNSKVPAGIATDFYGNPRIVDGNGDGESVVDMGACEYKRPCRPLPRKSIK